MAELSLRDRLQPSLLDRLTDRAPTRLNVLLSFSPATLAQCKVTEDDLRLVLRQAGLKLQDEKPQDEKLQDEKPQDGQTDQAADRTVLVLQAPEPFMSAAEFAALPVGEPPVRLDAVADISYRRVRLTQETRDERFLSMQRLRECVLRDLNWLLNTGNLESLGEGAHVSDYAEVCRSVVNYGIPDITGMFARGASPELMERAITEAIRRFEPRILPESLSVRAIADESRMSRHSLSFVIEGQLWAQPLPEQLYLRTDLDLGSGEVVVREQDGGGSS